MVVPVWGGGAAQPVWWAVVVLLAVALLGGCGGKAAPEPVSGSSPATAPAAVTASPSSVEQVEEAVLEAYRCMWESYDRAGRAPEADPEDPRLAGCAAGEALEGLRQGLASMRGQGLVIEGEFVLNAEVSELDLAAASPRATVRDCGDSSGWRRVRADGESFEDTPGGRRLIVADLQRVEGRWLVVSFGVREVGSC